MKKIVLDMRKLEGKEVDRDKFYAEYYDEKKGVMKNGAPLVVHIDSHYVFLSDVPTFAFNKKDADDLVEWAYGIRRLDPTNSLIIKWRRK